MYASKGRPALRENHLANIFHFYRHGDTQIQTDPGCRGSESDTQAGGEVAKGRRESMEQED